MNRDFDNGPAETPEPPSVHWLLLGPLQAAAAQTTQNSYNSKKGILIIPIIHYINDAYIYIVGHLLTHSFLVYSLG